MAALAIGSAGLASYFAIPDFVAGGRAIQTNLQQKVLDDDFYRRKELVQAPISQNQLSATAISGWISGFLGGLATLWIALRTLKTA